MFAVKVHSDYRLPFFTLIAKCLNCFNAVVVDMEEKHRPVVFNGVIL